MSTNHLNYWVKAFLLALLAFGAVWSLGPAQARAEFGFKGFAVGLSSGGSISRQAGAHPDLTTHIDFNTHLNSEGFPLGDGQPKDIQVSLPPGLVGDPTAIPACPVSKLVTAQGELQCPITTEVGHATVLSDPSGDSPIFNLTHGPNTPALFGFTALNVPIYLEAVVRPGDYGISALSVRTTQVSQIRSVNVELWGVPGDPSHDAQRGFFGESLPSPLGRVPFLRTPTSCSGVAQNFDASMNSWEAPDVFSTASVTADSEGTPFVFGGCSRAPFKPSVSINAETAAANAPTGLQVDIEVPQNESPDGIGTADVRRTTVRFPQGFSISPAVASGLAACSEAQISLGTSDPPACPAASAIGSVSIKSPLLEEALTGQVFVASQGANPFGSNYALYLAAKGPGFYIKLPGKIEADATTGQLTATFGNQPQLPYESVSLQLDGGPNAALVTPAACGSYSATVELESWASALPVQSTAPLSVTSGCGSGGFSPGFKAGTARSGGGSFSPFTLQVTRNDGEANLSRIQATLPPGLLAKLAGVPLCGDAGAASGNCPAGSQVGTTTVGAGAGPDPLYVPEVGKAPTAVYLAGPYKGAPYSLVVKVPAQAGPFDLGTVVVRNALRVDPTTTQVTAESDPLPQILEGIPISYRDVRVEINRSEFTLNPTNCSQFQVAGTLTSASGQAASPKAPFAAANCERLGFKPTLALRMKGQTKRAGNPALTATLKAPPGQANIANTTVILPKTVFIDQRHVNNPCTMVQFNAGACPAKSVLGTAVAESPLLDKPLEGPVYFRANGGARKLPDIVADLNGQIHVILVGFIDSKKVGKEASLVRTRFASVPDAPVSRFVLALKGGKQGLIQNSANICRSQPKAEVRMAGQNGKTNDFAQKIAVKCGKAKKSKRPKH